MEWSKVFGISLIVVLFCAWVAVCVIAAVQGASGCPEGQQAATITTYNAALHLPTTLTTCLAK